MRIHYLETEIFKRLQSNGRLQSQRNIGEMFGDKTVREALLKKCIQEGEYLEDGLLQGS